MPISLKHAGESGKRLLLCLATVAIQITAVSDAPACGVKIHVRRERTERLLLVTPDGKTTELATSGREVGTIEAQDEFAVSPDGKYLAWTAPGDPRVHLRDAKGHERILPRYAGRMRFSPDGSRLAVLVNMGLGDWQKLIVWELSTDRVQSLFKGPGLGRFEWVYDGVVIEGQGELVHAPLDGEHSPLYRPGSDERLRRFTGQGKRVAVLVEGKRGQQLRAFNLDHTERVRNLGLVPGTHIEDAAASPDGTRFVLATRTGLYIADGNSAPRELSGLRHLQSLWFAKDGRLAYATVAGATVIRSGGRARHIESKAPIRMLRFDKESSRVLLAAGHEARAWDPETNQQVTLASAPEGEDVLGTDRYQGGVLLWTGRNGNTAPPHQDVLRVLRVARDGTSRDLERIEGTHGGSPGGREYFATAGVARSIGRGFFTASDDGRAVAYVCPRDGIHVRNVDGTERTIPGDVAAWSPSGKLLASRGTGQPGAASWVLVDPATGAERSVVSAEQAHSKGAFAFSPDGKYLAITRKGDGDHLALMLLDLATGKERPLPAADPISVDFTPRGLLVRHARGLSLWSPSGETRSVLDENLEAGLARVLTASTRALVCLRGGFDPARWHSGLLSIDLTKPAPPVELDLPGCWSSALWMSPDGEQVVYAQNRWLSIDTNELAVLSARGGAPPRLLGESYNEVVFGEHGRIAFLSHRGVRVVDAGHEYLFETDDRVASMQFAKDGSLRLAIGREVISWDPTKDSRTVVARASEGQSIAAVAAFGDGFLLATVE